MSKKVQNMVVQMEMDPEVLKMLLDKISTLEGRIQELELRAVSQDQAIALNATVMTEALQPGGLLYERMRDER